MYPNLYYAFKDLLGVEWKWLRFVNSFGFFVALSFLAAAYVLTLELKRKERAGLLFSQDVKIVAGKPASFWDLFLNFLVGFLLGYKIVGLFFANEAATGDPQEFIFSSAGNLPAGLLMGLLLAGLKWWDRHKHRLPAPEARTIRIWPHDRVGDLVIYAALFGFVGAKIFHNLENWGDFVKNPVEALLSFSGLTFYGGLICAAVAIAYYARKHGIPFLLLCDSVAPALMLAYALGRIGCQVAGDGDWGILNSAYISTSDARIAPANPQQVSNLMQNNAVMYTNQFGSLDQVPQKAVKGPSWLPHWVYAYNYPHNVINEGTRIAGCDGPYCNQLPVPVFPTPLYETVTCGLLFVLLWAIRKRLRIAGTLFAVYLVVNGVERFFIEKIRVNTKYDINGWHPTQAEIISSLLVIGGIILYFILTKRSRKAVTA